MFKKISFFIIGLLAMFVSSSVFAMTNLEKGVIDLLNSNNFLIQYKFLHQVTNTENYLVKKNNKLNKENPVIVTVAKMNGNFYSNTENLYGKQKMISTSIYKDGKSYMFGENKVVGSKRNHIMMMQDDYAKSSFNMWIDKFKGYLSGFVPMNSSGMSNISMMMGGAGVPLSSGVSANGMVQLGDGRNFVIEQCNVFSKVGTEVIAGKKLDFVEYKTDNNALNPAVCRYYFLNGVLVKYIKIDKEQTFNIDGEKHGTGGYTVVDVLRFTKNVNAELFELPKGAKIIENKFTNRGLY